MEGLYIEDNLADSISLLGVYIDIIRWEFEDFVRTWNSHKIRESKDRPNAVTGIPRNLYEHPPPGISSSALAFDQELHRSMLSQIQHWDTDEYLPYETKQWVDRQLQDIGFDRNTPELAWTQDRHSPYPDVYKQLRDRTNAHIRSGLPPTLALCDLSFNDVVTHIASTGPKGKGITASRATHNASEGS